MTNKKRVYVDGSHSFSENSGIVMNAKSRVVFFEKGSSDYDIKVVQYTPAIEHLRRSLTVDASINLKNCLTTFWGNVMIFDMENNFLKGYRISNSGIKSIKLQLPLNSNKNSNESNGAISNSNNLCDNGISIDPNCTYIVHTTYDIICNGNWSPDEGFNPNYCEMALVSIDCELLYCNIDGALQQCLDAGNTEEACFCNLFGICPVSDCSGVTCDPNLVSPLENDFNNYVQYNMEPSVANLATTSDQNQLVSGTHTWIVIKGGVNNSWRITALIDYKYNKRTYLTTDFQRVNEFDMFYYKTLSTFFEGSNVKIESTWQHQNVISPNMDIVINNDTKDCYGYTTIIGTVKHEMEISQNVIPGCLFCPKKLSTTTRVENSLKLYPR